MNRKTKIVLAVLELLTLGAFGLLPEAQAVTPPPDGCYAGLTTAEGCDALRLLTGGKANTAVGWHSLFSAGDANFNTGVGAGALALTTTGADSNTAVGTASMLLNTTGFINTAIGTDALLFNDSGAGNSAVGAFALYNNIDGSDNSAFGRSALVQNIHAHGNTAIGAEALRSNDATGNNVARFNTAIGAGALVSNTDGELNTAVGFVALSGNTVGHSNQAMGAHALANNENGVENVAIGHEAMNSNVNGLGNVAIGHQALFRNIGGVLNTVVGWHAGHDVDGIDNIYIGDGAGAGIATEDFTTRIGNLAFVSDCYIAGIYGSTYGPADLPVRIGNDGKLGTMASSARFKKDIRPMDKASESILALNPVRFHYKNDAMGIPQFGLVAEEVAKVNPDLVVLDSDGQPYTVRYEQVNAMLLNEFLKEHRKNDEQQYKIDRQEAKMARQEMQIQALTASLKAVSDQIKLSKFSANVARVMISKTAKQKRME
jgi:trimeric autotransporter adhesin